MLVILIVCLILATPSKMATSSDVEEQQLLLESKICCLPSEKLEELAEHLELPLAKYAGKSKLITSRWVREKVLEETEREETAKGKWNFLKGIQNFIEDKPPPLDEESKSSEVSISKQASQGKKNKFIDVDNVFRREFKIKGTVGLPGDENKLSFISLARQIESGLERGYHETEIIEAVIRSVGPGIALRSYLEATPDLTLAKLRQILRSYYRENSATEMFQQLATLTQFQNEDPQAFLMRALELRQKILFVSKESDTTVKYEKQLVQNLFIHSVETGLRDDAIRVKIRPYLQKPNVLDEQLISELNKAATTETERKVKFGQLKQRVPKAVCSQVEVSEPKLEKKPNKLVEQVASMQAEIFSLREAISSMATKSAHLDPKAKSKRKPACTECQKSNQVTQCNHCFYCGSDEHFARGCKKASLKLKSQSGKGARLQPGDRE